MGNMAMKPGLEQLKAEIDRLKKEENAKRSEETIIPRDVFLNGLLESLNTGRQTMSTNILRNVNDSVEGGKPNPMGTTVRSKPSMGHSQGMLVDDADENYDLVDEDLREDQLYSDIQNKTKKILSEIIDKKNVAYRNQRYGLSTGNAEGSMGPSVAFGGDNMAEMIEKTVYNYLIKNFASLVDSTVRGMMLEMYSANVIKRTMVENKDIIKKIVYETIREIQSKSKRNKMEP